jgi:hypothetical protein
MSVLDWRDKLGNCHIMPFEQIESSLKTGIEIRKELHCLLDRYNISIDPDIWKVHLDEEGHKHIYFIKYHNITPCFQAR